MSPEQARGENVDSRTDVWSFGCLVFELLAGRSPFLRGSFTDTLAAIVRDAPDWSLLPEGTPRSLRTLLTHCLAKDPRKRLRHIGDALLRLDELDQPNEERAERNPAASSRSPRVWIAATGLLALAVAFLLLRNDGATEALPEATWTDLRLAGLEATTNRWGTPPMAISPDGRTVVFVFHEPDREPVLAVRSLEDRGGHRVLPGTENADGPFFSHDGSWVGFYTEDALFKVPLSGSSAAAAVHRFEVPTPLLGATWTPDDTIVFGVVQKGLVEVPVDGGPATALTVPDFDAGEVNHGFPFVLPGGRHLLFAVAAGMGAGLGRPALLSRDSGEWHLLLDEGRFGTQPHYLPSGQLVYALGAQLFAAPFDLDRMEVTREPRPVLEEIHADMGSGVSHFALSPDGSLAFIPKVNSRLVWVDREGGVTPIVDVAAYYLHPRVSPDGSKVTLLALNGDVWVVDVERKNMERLTFGGDYSAPLWSNDGEYVTYARNRPDGSEIAMRRADGSGEPVVLMRDRYGDWPMSWSADGKELAYERRVEGGNQDIYASRPDEPESTRALVSSPFGDESPRFSPDGRWLAYVSNHTGAYEVYITTWPALDRRWQVSSGGGVEPAWSKGGQELIYRDDWRVLAVPVAEQGGELELGRAEILFEGHYNRSDYGHAHYDVTPDGQRFVMVEEDREAFELLRLVIDWDGDPLSLDSRAIMGRMEPARLLVHPPGGPRCSTCCTSTR